MNRDQYFNRYRNLNLERELMERKWRAFQEEQELMEQMRIFEAARAASSAAAVASGAGGGFIRTENTETVLFTFTMEDQPNWYYAVMGVETETITDVYDTGVPKNWSSYDSNIVQNKGYMISFYDGGNYKVIFTDKDGKQVFDFSTFGFSQWDADGRGVLVLDPDGSPGGGYRFYYFDGEKVGTHDFEGEVNGFEVGTNWDVSMKSGSIAVKIVYIDGSVKWYLIDVNGAYLIGDGAYGDYPGYFFVHSMTDYGVYLINDKPASSYIALRFISSTGVVLKELDLTEYGYTRVYLWNGTPHFWGINQCDFAFYDADDVEKDWLLISFNGKDLVSYQTERGTSYDAINLDYQTVYPTDDYSYQPGSIAWVMWSTSSAFPAFSHYDVATSSVKFVYKFNSDANYHEYAPAGNFSWRWRWPCSDKSIIVQYTTDGDDSHILALLPGEAAPVSIVSRANNYYDWTSNMFGDYFYISYNLNDAGTYTQLYVYNYNLTFSTSGSFIGEVYNYRARFNSLFIRNWNGDTNYYFNTTSIGDKGTPEILGIGTFYSQRGWDYNSEFAQGVNDGTMVLVNPPYYSGPSFRVLKSDSITEDIPLEYYDSDWGWDVSQSYFFYWTFAPNGGLNKTIKMFLYDLNGNLLNTVSTDYSGYDNWDMSDKRLIFNGYVGDPRSYTFLFPDKTLNFDLSKAKNYGYLINDYRWWD